MSSQVMNSINPFIKVDMKKHAGRVLAIHPETGDILATAKEKRSLKYDKSIKAYIIQIPDLPVQSKQITRVALVLDESSSMEVIQNKTVDVFNSILNSNKEEAEKNNQDSRVYFYTFASTVKTIYKDRRLNDTNTIRLYTDYSPNGWTSLFDAVGIATNEFKENHNPDEAYLIYVVTDGDENWSKKYNSSDIRKLIDDCNKLGNFTFIISLPFGRKTYFCQRYNIPLDNVIEWENTEKGIKTLGEVTTSGLSNYYNARSRGVRAVTNFFVNTDLSNVTQKDLNKLKDLSNAVKIYEVPKECVIKDFVEEKTKKPYIIGQAYYELTKKETIQPQKSIMIQNKQTKKVYSGEEARDLLGLPKGQTAKVEVGNHANYLVFSQSTSVNRKLVRGSHVLLDLTKSTNSTPTWS